MKKIEKFNLDKKRWFEREDMPNGEIRRRFKINDKIIFSTTTNKEHGWQMPYYHTKATEKYLVIKGNILIAVYKNEKVFFKRLFSGQKTTILPNVKHNIFVNANTLFYVLKKSQESLYKDWYFANNFDIFTHKI